MCKACRLNCRGIRFDFQCKKFYHDYCESSSYTRPDLVCFLNPALHRPGYRGFDTWPKSVDAALKTSRPVLITALTESDCYLDLQRVKKLTNDEFEILLPPLKNPYSSTRPERNFSSDEDVPLTFKNNFMFAVSKIKDLIEF
jgi:splicing suppressor protein 51